MLDDRRADDFADALYDIEHARRDARFERELGEHNSGHRCLLGGLQHHAVAGTEGIDPERCAGGRAVPGDDRADDADRLAHLVHGEVVRHGRDRSVELAWPARVVVDAVGGELDDEARVEAQQARVDHVELGELVAVLDDELGQAAEAPLLLERRQEAPAPVLERRARGTHGAFHVCGRARGRDCDLLARCRVDHRHGLSVQRRDDLAVDHVPEQLAIELARRGLRDGISGYVGKRGHAAISPQLLS